MADVFVRSKTKAFAGLKSPQEFFASISTLTYNHLLSVIINSKSDYMKIFTSPYSETPRLGFTTMPRFLIRLGHSGPSALEYDPSLEEVEEAILEGLTFVTKTMEYLPKIEPILTGPLVEQILKLGSQEPLDTQKDENHTKLQISGVPELRVCLEAKEFDAATKKLKASVSGYFELVKKGLVKYDAYLKLFSNDMDVKIAQFFTEEHNFEEYTEVRFKLKVCPNAFLCHP